MIGNIFACITIIFSVVGVFVYGKIGDGGAICGWLFAMLWAFAFLCRDLFECRTKREQEIEDGHVKAFKRLMEATEKAVQTNYERQTNDEIRA